MKAKQKGPKKKDGGLIIITMEKNITGVLLTTKYMDMEDTIFQEEPNTKAIGVVA